MFAGESSHGIEARSNYVPVHHLLCPGGRHRINYIGAAGGQQAADDDPKNQAHATLPERARAESVGYQGGTIWAAIARNIDSYAS
jgi:hypothetical protein